MELLASLNERQREAAATTEGPLLILAGAGSGKTRVITFRIAHLIREKNVAPFNILAVTFTNKAAQEMRERVEKLLEGAGLRSAPLVATFHGLCVRILRRDIDKLQAGYTRSFTIYDQDDSVRIVKTCVKDLGYDEARLVARQVQGAISSAKNSGLDPEQFSARVESHDEKRAAIARVYKLYEERLTNNNALDFDDLLIKTVRLLRHDADTRARYNDRFRYILVDEYQDTNNLQFALIRLLSEKSQNVCVVGDEDQCVTAETMIETSRGVIRADEVRTGDEVLSAKGEGRTTLCSVTRVHERRVINQPVITMMTRGGHTLTTTPEHVHFAGDRGNETEREQRSVNDFSVTLCKRGRRNTSHYCEVLGSDAADADRLTGAGLRVTAHKRAGWRVRVTTGDFAKITALHEQVRDALGGVNLILKASFTSGTSLHFTPASHVLPGMRVFVRTPEGIAHDEVVNVERSAYTGAIYDFDVARTHNFVAGNIFTHNSIYKWRGADISNILNFEQHYANAKVVRLEQNYRSTGNILQVAGAVVKNNTERKGKELWTSNEAGASVRYYQALDGDTEARFVAAKIDEHLRADPKTRAAILYRTNSQSRLFEEALRRNQIAYNIVGGFSFYERAEVKDIVAYLKLALNPHDSVALLRVINTPARGLGKQSLDELDKRAKDYGVSLWETINLIANGETEGRVAMSPRAVTSLKSFRAIIASLVERAAKEPASEVVKAAILDSGYAASLKVEGTDEAEARVENLQELVNAAVDYDKEPSDDDEGALGAGLRDFIDSAALSSDTDKYDREAPVTMMTVHSAKGLEFPVVFVVGLEDGLFPHSRAAADKSELEEERRLMYVAITRAERQLYVTHAMRRRVYGEEMASEPSQFLNEMPLELMEDLTRGASWLSFARGSSALENKHAARALRGQTTPSAGGARGGGTGAAKTYDSVESIAEFFRQRSAGMSPTNAPSRSSQPSGMDKMRAESASRPKPAASSASQDGFTPGSHVKHAKYGRGLVLRREGTGDAAKLTVSFPGFGQKKLIEKYAGLEKA